MRVYVGLDSASTAQERAALAVKELERTGAFDRALLVVAGTTGTGWLEPQTVDTIEYEWNGDTAIVGIQYSFLPSWISTLVDAERAADAGKAVYDAVYAKWLTLPAGSRPKLMAYGLSLGSYSIQAAFPDAADMTVAHAGRGARRVAQLQPAVGRDLRGPRGRAARSGSRCTRRAPRSGSPACPADLASPAGAYGPPRIAYAQHANDPVVWWSPQLLVREPDWLAEPPGPGRTPTMRWYPILTFLQVTVDQFTGVDVPDGQGHNYGGAMPATWASRLAAAGLDRRRHRPASRPSSAPCPSSDPPAEPLRECALNCALSSLCAPHRPGASGHGAPELLLAQFRAHSARRGGRSVSGRRRA